MSGFRPTRERNLTGFEPRILTFQGCSERRSDGSGFHRGEGGQEREGGVKVREGMGGDIVRASVPFSFQNNGVQVNDHTESLSRAGSSKNLLKAAVSTTRALRRK